MKSTTNKIRWFWAWDDEKEEAWLSQMASQGFHLVSPNPFGSYTFSQGEPRQVAYRLDYVTNRYVTDDYYQLFQEAGWEHVGQMGGWQYWRKPFVNGQDSPEIFTDNESKIQKYRRLLGILVIALPVILVILNNLTLRERTLALEVLIFIEFLIAALLGYAIVRLMLRIRALQRR